MTGAGSTLGYTHGAASVDPGARIGSFTSNWHYSHVESGVVVGENCHLGQNLCIGNNAIVGQGCRLGISVSMFSHVELGDFAFCAPFMAFTYVAFPRAAVNRRERFEKTFVSAGISLGANSTVVPGIAVGAGTFLAAGSMLTKDNKDWSMMLGTPARQIGWAGAYGERIPLPLAGDGE